MGIIVPRPAMRHAEERTIRRNLEAHAARMKELIATGMGVTEASAQALKDILAKPPKAPSPQYISCSCTGCGWQGSRTAKGMNKACPKCKESRVFPNTKAGDRAVAEG